MLLYNIYIYIYSFLQNLDATVTTSDDSELQQTATGKKRNKPIIYIKETAEPLEYIQEIHDHSISTREFLHSSVLVEDVSLSLCMLFIQY